MRTLVVIILLASQLANAATKTWTGATNSDWNTGSNSTAARSSRSSRACGSGGEKGALEKTTQPPIKL